MAIYPATTPTIDLAVQLQEWSNIEYAKIVFTQLDKTIVRIIDEPRSSADMRVTLTQEETKGLKPFVVDGGRKVPGVLEVYIRFFTYDESVIPTQVGELLIQRSTDETILEPRNEQMQN